MDAAVWDGEPANDDTRTSTEKLEFDELATGFFARESAGDYGEFSFVDDSDWYSLRVHHPGKVKIRLDPPGEGGNWANGGTSGAVEIYRSDGVSPLAGAVGSPVGYADRSVSVVYSVPASDTGNYVVRIRSHRYYWWASGGWSDQRYALSATFEAAASILPVADQTTDEDTASASVSFTITGSQTPGSLTLTAHSDDQTVLPDTNFVLGGAGVNRTITVTPAANRSGRTTVTLTVTDGSQRASTSFLLTVTPVYDSPSADPLSASTLEDTPLAIVLAGSDLETTTSGLLYVVPSGPSHGILTGTPPSLTYTPSSGYSGADSFTFTVTDRGDPDGCTGSGTTCSTPLTSSTATVAITVTAVNHAPKADNQTISTAEDTPLAIVLTATDQDSNPLTYRLLSSPSRGTLSGTPQSLTYTPSLNYHGPDSFTFTATDGSLDAATATIAITVTARNDSPLCTDLSVTLDEGSSADLTPSCTDVDADTLSYRIVDQGTRGTASVLNGMLHYVPTLGATGSDQFTYTANDGQTDGTTATVSVSITVLNHDPLAVNDTLSVVQNSDSTSFSVLANDSDPDQDPLSITAVTQPSHGQASITPNGLALSYRPSSGYVGPDSFTYIISDGRGRTATASVAVTVTAANRAPTCSDVVLTTTQGQAGETSPACADADGTTLSYQIAGQGAKGTASVVNGTLRYVPTAGASGSDSFTYQASDGSLASNVATVGVTITVQNIAPTAQGRTVSTQQDTPIIITLQGSDGDSPSVSFSLVEQPSHGSLGSLGAPSCSPSGGGSTCTTTLRYTPVAGFSGADQFTFQVADGSASSAPATVAITITPPSNTPPRISTIPDQTIAAGTATAVLPFTVSDAETAATKLTVSATSSNLALVPQPGIVLTGTGGSRTVKVTPTRRQTGRAVIRLVVSDGTNTTSTEFKVTVRPQPTWC